MKIQNEYVTRRQLFKDLYTLAGSAVLAGSLSWVGTLKAEDQTSVSASDRVNIGMIGVGSRGRLLLEYLKMIPSANIVAVCDNYQPNYDRAMELAEGKAQGYKDYQKLLDRKDIDAVVIATPLHLHAKMSIDAMDSGKQVFCEKALAKTIEECRQLKEAQKRTGKILQVGHQRMFDIRYIKALEMVKSGKLGPITQLRAWWHRNNDWRRHVPSPELERKINWRLYREYSLGLMTELASHHLQVANWFLGSAPLRVMGSGSTNFWKDGREIFDNVNLVYEYPGGVHLVYDSMNSNEKYHLEIQVMGNKGTFELEEGKYYTEHPPKPAGIRQLINDIENDIFDAIPVAGASWIPGTASKYKGEYIVDQRKLPSETKLSLEAFVESVRQNKPAIADNFEQGIDATIACVLGDQAMIKNKIIEFPKDI